MTTGAVPPESSRPRRVGVLIASGTALTGLAALGWWALAPLRHLAIDSPVTLEHSTTQAAPTETTVVALDVTAFSAPLWIAPPAPPAPAPAPKPEPPPPPLKFQILAIAREETDRGADVQQGADDRHRALLYDPETDKPFWVTTGQAIGTRKVEKITAAAVEIREGKLLRTLVLREAKPATSALERALRGPSPRSEGGWP